MAPRLFVDFHGSLGWCDCAGPGLESLSKVCQQERDLCATLLTTRNFGLQLGDLVTSTLQFGTCLGLQLLELGEC